MNSLQERKNDAKNSLQLNDFYVGNKIVWTNELWENTTWEDFFSGERDNFLFNNSFNLPIEYKEIQRLLLIIKNMQAEIEIGNEKEIDFLAISILIDAYHRSYVDKIPVTEFPVDNFHFSRPYNMAANSIRNLWSVKRRTFILDQIVYYLGYAYSSCEESINELRNFAKGKCHLQTWKIYFLIGDLPVVSVTSAEYGRIQQILSMLSNFNNLSIGFYEALRDKTNLEKQGANIMHSYNIWFDDKGAWDRLICETSKDMAYEAELEEAMLSALKKKFVPKRNETYKSAFNSFLHRISASNDKNLNELPEKDSQLKSLPDSSMLENKMALVLKKIKKDN